MVNCKIDWVNIGLLKRCTGMCPHCAYGSTPDKEGEIPFNGFKAIADQFPEAGVYSASFNIGGESTLYDRFPDAIAYLNDLRERTGHPKRIGLMTNAHWAPTRETALKTIRTYGNNGLDEIYVCADKLHYIRFGRQIEVLKDLCEKESSTPTIGISVIEGVEVSLIDYKLDPIILPLIRGENLPESEQTRPSACSLMKLSYNSSEDRFVGGLSILPEGYRACVFGIFHIGDLDEKMIDVFKRRVDHPLQKLLGRPDYTPKRLLTEEIVRKALPQGFIKEGEKLKECTFCQRLFENEEAREIVTSLVPEILGTLQ